MYQSSTCSLGNAAARKVSTHNFSYACECEKIRVECLFPTYEPLLGYLTFLTPFEPVRCIVARVCPLFYSNFCPLQLFLASCSNIKDPYWPLITEIGKISPLRVSRRRRRRRSLVWQVSTPYAFPPLSLALYTDYPMSIREQSWIAEFHRGTADNYMVSGTHTHTK